MDGKAARSWARPMVTLALVGVAAASLLIAPVGAHTKGPGHLWREHIRPKSDNRYDQSVVLSDTTPQTTTSTEFVDLPGATTTVTVPGGPGPWRVVARFDAESLCAGPNLSWCSVRILIGDQPGEPDGGTDYAFDSPPGTPGVDRAGHALTRSRLLGRGTYDVAVQYAVTAGATSLQLDDWHLTVETLRVG